MGDTEEEVHVVSSISWGCSVGIGLFLQYRQYLCYSYHPLLMGPGRGCET